MMLIQIFLRTAAGATSFKKMLLIETSMRKVMFIETCKVMFIKYPEMMLIESSGELNHLEVIFLERYSSELIESSESVSH